MSFARLVFCRHGQSENNVLQDISHDHYKKHRLADPDLTPTGFEQAKAAGDEIKRLIEKTKPARVLLYASPMKRALRTAQQLALSSKVPIRIAPNAFEAGGIFRKEVATTAGAAMAGSAQPASASVSGQAPPAAAAPLELTLEKATHLVPELDRDQAAMILSEKGWYHDKTYCKEPCSSTLKRAAKVARWVRSLQPMPAPEKTSACKQERGGGAAVSPSAAAGSPPGDGAGHGVETAAAAGATGGSETGHDLIILVSHVVFMDSMLRFVLGGTDMGCRSVHAPPAEQHGDGSELGDVPGTSLGDDPSRVEAAVGGSETSGEGTTTDGTAASPLAVRPPDAARLAWHNCGLTVVDLDSTGEVALQHANRTSHLARRGAELGLGEGALLTGCNEALDW